MKTRTKVTWAKVFGNKLDKGDFIRFVSGKVIWRVKAKYSSGNLNLQSCNQPYGIEYFLDKDSERVFRVDLATAFRFVLRRCPNRVNDYFSEEQLTQLSRHICMEEVPQ